MGLRSQTPQEGPEFVNIYPEKAEKTFLINLNQAKASHEDAKEEESTNSD